MSCEEKRTAGDAVRRRRDGGGGGRGEGGVVRKELRPNACYILGGVLGEDGQSLACKERLTKKNQSYLGDILNSATVRGMVL